MIKTKFAKNLLLLFILLSLLSILNAQVLMGRNYYDVVKQHIVSAKDSINIAMYFVIIDDKSDNPVNDLVDEVILAHQRAINVKFGTVKKSVSEDRLNQTTYNLKYP